MTEADHLHDQLHEQDGERIAELEGQLATAAQVERIERGLLHRWVAFHVEASGMNEEIVCDQAKFKAFMDNVDRKQAELLAETATVLKLHVDVPVAHSKSQLKRLIAQGAITERVAELEAQLAAVAQEAAGYRYLRDTYATQQSSSYVNWSTRLPKGHASPMSASAFDAAIAAAVAAKEIDETNDGG